LHSKTEKIMKKTLLMVIVLLLTGMMRAADTDWHIGIEAGYNYSPQMPLHGFQAGVVVDLPFGYVTPDPHTLGCEIGLDYGLGDYNYLQHNAERKEAYQQFKEDVVDDGGHVTAYSEHIFWHSLNVPIRIYYTYAINSNWMFRVYSGPSVRFNVAVEERIKHEFRVSDHVALEQSYSNYVSGKCYSLERYDDEEYRDDSDIEKSERIPRCNLAWGLGFGFMYKNISLNVRYDLDLLFKQKPRDVLAVTLAYRIR